MAITQPNAGTQVAVGSGNMTVNYPTRQSGDLLILVAFCRAAATFGTAGAITGWTQVITPTSSATYGSLGVWARRTDNAEGTSLTVNSTGADTSAAGMVAFRGVYGSTSTDGFATASQNSAETQAAGATRSSAGVSPDYGGSALVLIVGDLDGTAANNYSGWTGGVGSPTWNEAVDVGSTTNSDASIGIAWAIQAATGASGTLSATGTANADLAGTNFSLALRKTADTYSESVSDTAKGSDGFDGSVTTAGGNTTYDESISDTAKASDGVAGTVTQPPGITHSMGPYRSTIRAGVTSTTVTFNGTNSDTISYNAGDVIVVGFVNSSASATSTPSIAGGTGVDWATVGWKGRNKDTNNQYGFFVGIAASDSGTPQTVTVTFNGSSNWAVAYADVFSGVSNTAPFGTLGPGTTDGNAVIGDTVDFTSSGRTGSLLLFTGVTYNGGLGTLGAAYTSSGEETDSTGSFMAWRTAMADAGSYTLTRPETGSTGTNYGIAIEIAKASGSTVTGTLSDTAKASDSVASNASTQGSVSDTAKASDGVDATVQQAGPTVYYSALSDNQAHSLTIPTVPANSWVIVVAHHQVSSGTFAPTVGGEAATFWYRADENATTGSGTNGTGWGTKVARYWHASGGSNVVASDGLSSDGRVGVIVVTGSDSSGAGAAVGAQKIPPSAMQVSLDPDASGSLLLAFDTFVCDSTSTNFTAATNNTTLYSAVPATAMDAVGAGRYDGNPDGSAHTLGWNEAGNNVYGDSFSSYVVAVEIKTAAGGGAQTYTGSISDTAKLSDGVDATVNQASTFSVVSGFPVSQNQTSTGVSSWTITLPTTANPLLSGDKVLIFVGLNGPDGGTTQLLTTPTPTSANLTWSLVSGGRSNVSANGQGGDAEVWQATVGVGGIAADEVVTLKTIAQTASSESLGAATAVAFRGAGTIRALTANNASSAVRQITMTGLTAGSFLYAVGSDWSQSAIVEGAYQAATDGSALSGQYVDHGYSPAGAMTVWAEHYGSGASPTANPDTTDKTIGIQTAHAGWNIVGVEILSAGGGAQTYSESISDTAKSSDGTNARLTAIASISDVGKASDGVEAKVSAVASISDTAKGSDDAASNLVAVSSISDTAKLSDNVDGYVLGGAVTYSESISDTAKASDGAAAQGSLLGSLSDTAKAGDGLDARARFGEELDEGVTAVASDAVAGRLILTASVGDTAKASDGAEANASTTGSISDTAKASDGCDGTILGGPQTYTGSISDAAKALDDAQTNLTATAANAPRKNAIRWSQPDFSAGGAVGDWASPWNRRSTNVTWTQDGTYTPTGTQAAKLSGVGADTVDDFWITTSSSLFPPLASTSVSFWIKRVSVSGIIDVWNAAGLPYGRTRIDLANIGADWVHIDGSAQTGVTYTTQFTADTGGGCGLQFRSSVVGASFYIAEIQAELGTTATPWIPTTSAVVTISEGTAKFSDAVDATVISPQSYSESISDAAKFSDEVAGTTTAVVIRAGFPIHTEGQVNASKELGPSATFSAKAGDRLIVLVGEHASSKAIVDVGGSTLEWSLVVAKSQTNHSGSSEVWTALVGGADISGETVTVTTGSTNDKVAFDILAFDNASQTLGATNTNFAENSGTAVNVTVNAQAARSLVVGVADMGSYATPVTADSNSTRLNYYVTASTDQIATVQRKRTTAAGNATVGFTDTPYFNMAAVEVKEAGTYATYTESISDTAKASDGALASLVAVASISDAAKVSDGFDGTVVGGAQTYTESISDTAKATDDVQAGIIAAASVADTAKATDDVQASVIRTAAVSDTAKASDGAQATLVGSVSVSDTAKASDAAQSSLVAVTSVTDTALAKDGTGAAAVVRASLADTAVASDTVSARAVFVASDSATALAKDGVEGTLVGSANTFTGSFSDTATASDSVGSRLIARGSVADTAVASDGFDGTVALASVTYTGSFSDRAVASDGIAVTAIRRGTLSDTAKASDGLAGRARFPVQESATAIARDGFAGTVILAPVTYAESLSDTAKASDGFIAAKVGPGEPFVSLVADDINAKVGVPFSFFYTFRAGTAAVRIRGLGTRSEPAASPLHEGQPRFAPWHYTVPAGVSRTSRFACVAHAPGTYTFYVAATVAGRKTYIASATVTVTP